jgi:integrase
MNEEGRSMINPVTRISLRLPKPLPRHLKDDQVRSLFAVIRDLRDRAMFMLMLRCGLRVEEVARLSIDAIEYPRRHLFVFNGKGIISSPKQITLIQESSTSKIDVEVIIIATWSRAKILPIPGVKSNGVLTSNEILSIKTVPESLLIIGGGAEGGPISCRGKLR